MNYFIDDKKVFFWCVVIFFLALFFRLFKLDSTPYGFHIDEAKAGWNAYSILKTGADDKGKVLALYYDSFGDFRPTGMLYVIIPSLILFGQTVFAVRFPFALIGALTIFPLVFIIRELSKNHVKIGIAAALIISLNPWHIIASRSTSESIISMFLTLWGIYFLLKSLKNIGYRNILASILFFVLSYFFYHSIRVLAPIFVFAIIFLDWISIKSKPISYQPLIILIVLVISSALFLSSKEAKGRMSQVSLKSDFKVLYEVTKMPNEEGPGHVFEARAFHNRIASYMRRFAEEYKEYFGTSFLLGNTAKPIRYTVPQVGLLTYFDFLLMVLGLFWVSRRKELLVIVILLALAPLPGAVTIEDTPNLQRAVYMIPFLVIIAAYGLSALVELPKKFRVFLVFVLLGYIFNFVYFFHMYFVHQKMSIASYYRNGGSVELVKKIENRGLNYNEIVLTNSPDDLYPWVAFLGKYDPKIFNQTYKKIEGGVRRYKNIVFSADKCPLNTTLNKSIKGLENTLFVDAEGCEIDSKFSTLIKVNLIETIKRPDASPPYYLRSVETTTGE